MSAMGSGGGRRGAKGNDPSKSLWDNWQANGLPSAPPLMRKFGLGGTALHDSSFVVPRIQRHLDLHPEPAEGYGVQRKGDGAPGGGVKIPDGGGNPLPGGVKSKMQSKLGTDLSDVRVHTGSDSEKASEDLAAEAFTVGSDVHFNAGKFDPSSKQGEKLLAHELTHVAQNKRGGVQRKEAEEGGGVEGKDGESLDVSDPDEPAEKEADAKADEIVDGSGAKGEAVSEVSAPVATKIFRAAVTKPLKAIERATKFGQTVSVKHAGTQLTLKVGSFNGSNALQDVMSAPPLAESKNPSALGHFEKAKTAVTKAEGDIAKIAGTDTKGVTPAGQTAAESAADKAKDGIDAAHDLINLPTFARCKTREDAPQQDATVGPEKPIPAKAQAAYNTELDRQLKLQQNGLKNKPLDQWMANVDAYQSTDQTWFQSLADGAREAVMAELLERFAELEASLSKKMPQFVAAKGLVDAVVAAYAALDKATTPAAKKTAEAAVKAAEDAASADPYIVNNVLGRHGNEDDWRKDHAAGVAGVLARHKADWDMLDGKKGTVGAILHNPDQGAGGKGNIPEPAVIPPAPGETGYKAGEWKKYLDQIEKAVGSAAVNSTIGASWGDQIVKARNAYVSDPNPDRYPFFNVNIKLNARYA